MTGLRLAYVFLFLASCYIQCCYGVDSIIGHDDPYYRTLPCPNPEDIAPCACFYFNEGMHMNCTHISDDEELHQVFHSLIPFPAFRSLSLPTERLTTLSETVFGEVTFENVEIHCQSGIHNKDCDETLTTIDPNTFMKSVSTLRSLEIYISNISEFPFDTIGEYLNIDTFRLTNSPLATFPTINSETLKELYLINNTFREIPAHVLDGVPKLTHLQLQHNNIDSLAKAFMKLKVLLNLVNYSSQLTRLHRTRFDLSGPS
ncbi:unnamed protein product, partial [Meganyctiphanes norvegica]